jgi:hypothetical protein
MVEEKIKKIVIIGSNSAMAKSFIKRNKNNYNFIKIGRKEKLNINKLLSNKLNTTNNYYAVLYFIGNFKKNYARINQNDFKINFLYLQKSLEHNYKSYLKKKRHIKFITLTSLDSIFPNINSVGYSVAKSASSHLILNYQRLHKKTKISYFDIQSGAVNTKMRKIKKGDALNVEEISKTIEHILSLDSNSTMLPIKIFPKLKNYPVY